MGSLLLCRSWHAPHTPPDGNKVPRKAVEDAIASLSGGAEHDVELVQVINAFDVPRVDYDPIRKCFYPRKDELHLHGDAQVRGAVRRLAPGPCSGPSGATARLDEICSII